MGLFFFALLITDQICVLFEEEVYEKTLDWRGPSLG